MLPATAMNLVFTIAAPKASRVECRDRTPNVQSPSPERLQRWGFPFEAISCIRCNLYESGGSRNESRHEEPRERQPQEGCPRQEVHQAQTPRFQRTEQVLAPR